MVADKVGQLNKSQVINSNNNYISGVVIYKYIFEYITVDQGEVLRVNLVQLYIFRISPSSIAKEEAKEDNKITKITGKN